MTEEVIENYYQRFLVPDRILDHMDAVASFASTLCDHLIEAGQKINKELVVQSALLHDCLRVCDIRNFQPEKLCQNPTDEKIKLWESLRYEYGDIGHEKAMSDILTKDAHPLHAQLIKMHAFFLVEELQTLDEKVLYYSDKRVEFDQVVSLDRRFEEGRKRNFTKDDDLEQVLHTENKVFQLEKELKELTGRESI